MFHIRHATRAVLIQVLIPVAAVILAVATPLAVQAQERVALVIGNSKYQNARPLPNAGNDGIDMMDTLSGLGFDVLGGTDLGYDEMNRLIGQFAERADNAEIALVFFAGHGVQADGRNYLIPVDARLATDRDLAFQAIDMSMLMIALERSRFGIILLDACRNNPFVARMAAANPFRNLSDGLARADAHRHSNLLVSYATHPGGVADDGDSMAGNSPYTTALLKYLRTDMDIYRVLAHVADEVKTATQGRQIPWIEGVPPRDEIRLAAVTTGRTLVPEPVSPHPVGGLVYLADDPPAPAPAAPTPQHPANGAALIPSAPGVTRCDELAANPADENKLSTVAGISKANIVWELAIPACEQAVATWPNVPRLQFQLGRALEAAERYAEAYSTYLLAAEKDYAHAALNIGDMHSDAKGVEQALETAFRWYSRAAELGSKVAYLRLAAAYADGRGVEQDFHQAARWFLLRAEGGSSYAMYWMGTYYLNTTSVGGNDIEQGTRWLERAADLGEKKAMILLGQHYFHGLARPLFRLPYTGNFAREDELLSTAETWLLKSGSQDVSEVRETLRFIEKRRACRELTENHASAIANSCPVIYLRR